MRGVTTLRAARRVGQAKPDPAESAIAPIGVTRLPYPALQLHDDADAYTFTV